MQTRPALLLVLVLALLATGCANRPNLSSGITTETVLSLPPDLEVPAGDTALLYPLSASPEGAKAQVEALVGQPLGEGEPGVSGTLYSLGQATVTIDQDTGYWTYETGQDIFSVDPSALPPPLSDAQAQAIALDYLQTHGPWSGPMASVGVGPITSGETGGDTILGKNVYCFPAVDGAPVEGVFRIVVTLDPTGKVVTVHHLAAQPGQPREVPLKSRAQLASDLARGNYSSNLYQTLTDPVVETCTLRLYADATPVEGQTYLYPVYVLTGHGTMPDGTTEWFEVIVDAQA